MLTPVRAVSNTDISFNSYTSQQQGGAASTMTPGNGAASNPAPQENTLLGRASVLALSGQLQLSQSVTVLAEALGRMLNIPRKDAESVDDYVNRLVQTIRGLSSSEREALNQQLTKVLQGLTLKIIAEVLKNPAGPDAARLAVLLEMTRYKDRDLAAKAVVSSYRQNTGNDLLAALPVKDQVAARAEQGAQPRPATMQGPPRQAEAAEVKTQMAEQAQKGPSLSAAAYAEETVDDAKAAARQPAVVANSAANATTQPKQETTAQPTGTKQEVVNTPAPAANEENPADDASSETIARSAKETVATKTEKPVSEALGGRDDRSIQKPHVDGRAAEPAKNNEAGGKPADYKAGLTKTDLENILLTSLAAQKLPQRAVGTSSYPAAISQMLESTPTDASKQGFAANAAGLAAAASSEPETPLPNVRNAAEVMQQGALSTEAKAAFEQPLLQSALASLTKEGLGMPFIANPQAKDEAEEPSPHRGRWPSSSDEGEEGQQDAEAHDEQPQGEQADGDEQHGPTAEDADNANAPDAGVDDAENAETYYLRMGGLA